MVSIWCPFGKNRGAGDWYTIYHHLPVVIRAKRPLYLSTNQWEKDIYVWYIDMEVSINGSHPKSFILIGLSIINHPFGGYPHSWKPPYLAEPYSFHIYSILVPYSSIFIPYSFHYSHGTIPYYPQYNPISSLYFNSWFIPKIPYTLW